MAAMQWRSWVPRSPWPRIILPMLLHGVVVLVGDLDDLGIGCQD